MQKIFNLLTKVLCAFIYFNSEKLNLYYTCVIMRKCVTSGGAHLCSLVPSQHSSEETTQHWRVVAHSVPDLTKQRFKSQTSCMDGV